MFALHDWHTTMFGHMIGTVLLVIVLVGSYVKQLVLLTFVTMKF